MNTIDWLREFRNKIAVRIDTKTGWGKVELRTEIEQAYQEILENIVNHQEKNKL